MKKLWLPLLILLLGIPALTLAQKDCGNGLPCGPLPWPLPAFPILVSPSPMPTLDITAVIPTSAPAPTTAPPVETYIAAPTVNTSGINDQMATLSSVMENTPYIVLNVEGTPVDTAETFDDLGSNAGDFFGYAKGLSSSQSNFGSLTPLIVFTLIAMVTVIAIKSLTFLIPLFAAIWGFIRKIIETVLEFIPL